MTSDSTPAFEIEKEALKTEIETGIQAGVDHLEAKTAKRKDADKYHNTRHLYTAFLVPTMLTMFSTRAFAADTIWTKASAIMQDVYTQILGISTIAAVVTAAIALLLMNFSRSGRTVDESRAWLKRIIITWAILNSLGFIMAYVTPFFSGGTWTP